MQVDNHKGNGYDIVHWFVLW